MKTSQNKLALVTGGAKRIGADIAVGLADHGYDIILHYNTSRDEAYKIKNIITNRGRRCTLVQADLTDPSSYNIFDSHLEKVTLLINNASAYFGGLLEEDEPDLLNQMLSVHVRAPYYFLHLLAKRKKHAHVINMLDAQIAKNTTNFFAYLLTKKTLASLTTMAAKELSPLIRVNGIAPGEVLTPENSIQNNKAHTDHTENIIKGMFYLIENDFVTGEILTIDGGKFL